MFCDRAGLNSAFENFQNDWLPRRIITSVAINDARTVIRAFNAFGGQRGEAGDMGEQAVLHCESLCQPARYYNCNNLFRRPEQPGEIGQFFFLVQY